jgi:hypothetical protein
MSNRTILVRVKRAQPTTIASIQVGEQPLPQKVARRSRKTFMNYVREILMEPSRMPDGTYNTRLEDAANAYAQFMERGSFIHSKEFIDREEGKVPSRIADAEGNNIKLYIGMPTADNDPQTP